MCNNNKRPKGPHIVHLSTMCHLFHSMSSTVCVFRVDRKNKMAVLASDWLRHFRLLLWNRITKFNETLKEARSQRPLPSFCFSGQLEKQDGRPGLWLAETFSTSSLKQHNEIQRNLTGSKISVSSTKFVFFGPIGKTRWPPWPLISWDIFDFSSETAKQNSTKLDLPWWILPHFAYKTYYRVTHLCLGRSGPISFQFIKFCSYFV